MNEISPEEAEAIIEAAANGQSLAARRDLGDVLNALNSPASTADHTAPLIAPPSGLPGRIMRRTAVAASSAVLGLATVAAATTGAPALLDPILGGDPAVVVVAEDELAPTAEGADDATDADDGEGVATEADDGPEAEEADRPEQPAQAQGPKDDHETGPAEPKGAHREIEGVDPSDGLDDEELMVACEAAENHGHYVSLVARDKVTETDGTHGERVSEAAASDCGKKGDDESETETGEEPEEAAEPDDEAEGRDPETEPGENGRKHGQGQGKGHLESNGKGHGGNNGNGVGNGHAKYDDNGED